MYFTYTSAQAYVRTLTQGVRISETPKLTGNYQRLSTQTTRVNESRILSANYKRDAFQNVICKANVNPLFTFFRQCFSAVGNSTLLSRFPIFSRLVSDEVKGLTVTDEKMDLSRICEDEAFSFDEAKRSLGSNRIITSGVNTVDVNSYSVVFVRTVEDTQGVTDAFQQWRDYMRFLYTEAGNIAETDRTGDFYRIQSDSVQVEGFSFRHLLIFVKLLSTSIVRDFFIRRFLIAKEQIILKSNVTTNLSLDSKIN